MRLSHLNLTIPKGSEEKARSFYSGLLGLVEIPKPEPLRARGGLWFDIGGVDLHLSAVDVQSSPDAQRHLGLEVADIDQLKQKLQAAGVVFDPGRPAPWPRFFVHDPFGNRLEFHAPGGLRS